MRGDRDTAIGGGHDRFPATRHSAVLAARSGDPLRRSAAHDSIVSAYWKPAYKYVRIRWRQSNEDAKDTIQGFFARAIEKGTFGSYDPSRASFRTYLRSCLDAYIANEHKAAGRLKRGGHFLTVSLDFDSAEGELALATTGPEGPDDYFQREWARALFGIAVERLRQLSVQSGKAGAFRLFEAYDLEDIPGASYDSLARETGLPVTTVTNYLAWARREFRRLVLETLREITGGEDEFRREARELLGVDRP